MTRVPIPPELVAILRQHIDTFGTALDGRIFASERGHVVASTAISDVWAEARTLAFTPEQVTSPLAGRPYDLRHAAVSLWLNAGVPATEVAEQAGHSVQVLLRVYAKCLDDGEAVANKRIDAALLASDARPRSRASHHTWWPTCGDTGRRVTQPLPTPSGRSQGPEGLGGG